MEVKIRVGCQTDSSLKTAFRPLIASALDARRQILQAFAALPREITALFGGLGRAQGGAFRGATAEARAAYREQVAIARAAMRDEERVARDLERDRVAAVRRAEREIVSEHQKAAREIAAIQKRQAVELDRFATRTSHRATRFFWPNIPIMSVAGRVGSEVMRGFGVDPSIAGAIGRGAAIQSEAVRLSNRGHVEGAAGPNGQVVDPKLLEKEARTVGNRLAIDAGDILKAQTAFVGLTGDLKLARELMPSIVAQTAAIGGNQEEAAKAAGEFAAHLGDVPNKAEKVATLMRIAAGQGKIGAVDFSDFAKYAASAASAAPLYAGDEAENISKLTALAEIAKMHGGARNAAQAFQSISSLTNTLGKGARTKAIGKLLGGTETQWANPGQFKDPFELVQRIISAAHGDLGKIQAAVGDARAMTAIRGLAVTYNRAGGGEKGEAAVAAELKKFQGAIMSQAEIERANKARLETQEAKAKLFQQRLDQIVQVTATKLLPALEALAPQALKLADAFGNLISWAAENPGEAIVAAIVASIARAGVESAFRTALEGVIKRAAGAVMGVPGGGVLGGGGGGAIGGARSALLGAAGAASVGLVLGLPIAAAIYGGGVSDVNKNLSDVDASARETGAYRAAAGRASSIAPAEREKMRRAILDREEQLKQLKSERYSGFTGFLEQAAYYMGGSSSRQGIDFTGRGDRIRQIESDLAEKRKSMAQIDATKYQAPDQIARYVAKDPSRTSRADMEAAFKRGGVQELEKIATLQSKQDTTGQQMLEQQKSGNQLLSQILEKITPPASSNTPSVDNPPGYEG